MNNLRVPIHKILHQAFQNAKINLKFQVQRGCIKMDDAASLDGFPVSWHYLANSDGVSLSV